MPIFMVISTHSPEYCPENNEKVRKATLEVMSKMDGLLKKHGVKIVGAWFGFVPSEHTHYIVYEAPSVEALQKLRMEPEIRAASAYDSQETKIVKSLEEITKELQQAK
jgi:hypothetical protein